MKEGEEEREEKKRRERNENEKMGRERRKERSGRKRERERLRKPFPSSWSPVVRNITTELWWWYCDLDKKAQRIKESPTQQADRLNTLTAGHQLLVRSRFPFALSCTSLGWPVIWRQRRPTWEPCPHVLCKLWKNIPEAVPLRAPRSSRLRAGQTRENSVSAAANSLDFKIDSSVATFLLFCSFHSRSLLHRFMLL